MVAHKVAKPAIQRKYFGDDLYVALDEILVGVVHIRMVECDIEDMRTPEYIRPCDDTVVELFVLEYGHEVTTSHIEEERLLITLAPMAPSEQECLVEKTRVFQDHPRELRFVVVDIFRLFYDPYVIRCILQILEQEAVVLRGQYDYLRGASVLSEP